MYVRTYASLFVAGLIGLVSLQPAARGENQEEEAAPVSSRLQKRMLTDERIGELCRAAILHKYDMVDAADEEGVARRVPRCVARYEAMREMAKRYLAKESTGRKEIVSAILACRENPDQASCLEAGRKLASKAADLHEELSYTAQAAVEHLATPMRPSHQ